MQISSINFGSTYKIAGKNQRKIYHSNYKPAKAKARTINPQKGLLTAGVSLGTVLLVLANPFGANKNTSIINESDIFTPPNPIVEEGEMPSSKYFDDYFIVTSSQEDASATESTVSITETHLQEATSSTESIEETQAPERNFEINLSEEQEMSLDSFVSNWYENIDRYKNMEDCTGIPAQLIAAIHWRESGGDFNTYLHNGARLGQTIDTYFGERWFNNWEDAAIDALNSARKVDFDNKNLETYYRFAEMYNGTGYSDYLNMNSPYVWAGTDKYVCGKYVADGVFDPDTVDRQVGVAVLLDSIMS